MAEYTRQQQQQEQGTISPVNKFQIIAKKKLEKLKNKFAEFFLSSSSSNSNQQQIASTTYNSSKSINKPTIFNSSDVSTTVRASSTQQHHKQQIAVHDLSYIPHTAFLFTNIKILKKFHSQYQLNTDDEDFQANLFDRVFMIDYIAFRLVQELNVSDLINKFHLDLRIPYFKNEFSLIYSIAKDIYTQSESEPMGLNGLNVHIELELSEQHQEAANSNLSTITRFRFNPNSTLSTFELRLVLKEDSSIMCLRKILPKSKLFDKLRIQSAIYLDSKYSLVKRKLY